jgi:hypothetical protein
MELIDIRTRLNCRHAQQIDQILYILVPINFKNNEIRIARCDRSKQNN